MKLMMKVLFFFALTLADASLVSAAENQTQEQIQAAMVYHLFNFISWPEHAPKTHQNRICMAPDFPGQTALFALENIQVKNKPIHVKTCEDTTCAKQCDILLLSGDVNPLNTTLLQSVSHAPVLTLAANGWSLAQKTLVSFYHDDKRLRISVRLSKMLASGFKVSSRLLRLVRIIDNEDETNEVDEMDEMNEIQGVQP